MTGEFGHFLCKTSRQLGQITNQFIVGECDDKSLLAVPPQNCAPMAVGLGVRPMVSLITISISPGGDGGLTWFGASYLGLLRT